MTDHRNNLLIAMLLFGLLLVCTGCPQGEDPAEAMMRDFQARNTGGSPAPANTDDTSTDTAKPAGSDLLKTADPAAGDNPCNPCGEAEDDYTGPKVTITIESIDNGIPEYTGKGKYEVRMEVQSDEVPATPSIWVIKAFDEEGNEVGEAKKHLTIPSSYPKILALSGFYCSSQPVSFTVRRAEGDAITIEEALAGSGKDDGGGVGRGAGGGGAPGRGAAGGGDDEDEDE